MLTITDSKTTFANHKGFNFCLPSLQECIDYIFGFLTEVPYNCGDICLVDRKYWVKWLSGSKFQIQTQFLNTVDPDITNPATAATELVEILVCLPDGTTEDATPYISRQMSAYGCCKSYQVFEFDTTTMPECFRLQFRVGEKILTTHDMQIYPADQCAFNLVEIQMVGSKDCENTCWDIDAFFGDNIDYTPSLFVEGHVRKLDPIISKTNVGATTSTTITDSFILQIGTKLPAFMGDMIARQILYGETVLIDGIEYTVPSQTLANILDSGLMTIFTVALQIECRDEIC